MHASFLWGPALAILFTVSEIFKHKKLDKADVLLTGSIVTASFLHVFYGPSYVFRLVFEFFNPAAQIPIREALPPTLETLFTLQGIVIAVSLLFLLYAAYKKRSYEHMIFPLALLAAAFLNGRFMRDLTIFLLVIVPLFLPMCETWFQTILLRGKKLPLRLAPWIFGIFLFALFLLAKNSPLGIGLGLEKFSYPVQAVEFLQQEQVLEKSQGNLYHTYNFGGYLTWANQPHKVFIDGRVRPYLGDVFQTYWNNFEGADVWKNSQQKYHITAALMTLAHTDGTTIYNDSSAMFPKEEWALVYYDDVAALYVKRLPELQELIGKNEYIILQPNNPDLSYLQAYIQSDEAFQEALTEVQRGLSINPESYRLHFTAAYIYSLAGQPQLIQQELEKTLKINPSFEPARAILESI
jgi:tetratricopeptide (TPR) repeat protein